MPPPPVRIWDAFIAHASEDKELLVEPLADALTQFGVKVWYDKFSLNIGDSLSRSIDQGLAHSNYGLIILSPSFFRKRWPEYELRGLTAREIAGKSNIILPIWHNISQRKLLRFSPPLADKLAINSAGLTPRQMAVQIIEVIRPDIFTAIHRRIASFIKRNSGSIVPIPFSKVNAAPTRHKQLPSELIGRIRLIRAALLGPHTHSMQFWVSGFKRDAHPSREVAIWERIAACYQEYQAMVPGLSEHQKKQVVDTLSCMSLDLDEKVVQSVGDALPVKGLEVIKRLYASAEPPFDIAEELPADEIEADKLFEISQDLQKLEKKIDRENFTDNLPEALIRELVKDTYNKRSPRDK